MRKLAAPGMAAFAIVAVLLGLWCSGRIAAWLIGQDAKGGLGLYLRYLHALGLAEWKPFVLRIWLGGVIGFGLPVLAWSVAAWRIWYRPAPAPRPRFVRRSESARIADQNGLIVGRLGRRSLRVSGRVLLASPPEARPDLAAANLLSSDASAIVLEIGARCFERTSGARQAQGQQVYRFDPWAPEGRSHGWNPLAELPAAPAERLATLRDIAAALYPERKENERFWNSLARHAFMALAACAFESTSDSQAPRLGTIARFAVHDASRITLRQLHDALPADHEAHRSLALLLAQDDGALSVILDRLATPLRAFLDPALLAATSRHDIRIAELDKRSITLYLTLPAQRLAEAWPLVALFFLRLEQLHAGKPGERACLMLMDGVTAFGPMEFYLRAMQALGHERWRWLTVVPSLDWLRRVADSGSLRRMLDAHPTVLAPASRTPDERTDYAGLLSLHRVDRPAPMLELQALKPGERLLCNAQLQHPLRCRTLRTDDGHALPPIAIAPLPQGEPMKLPLRLAATATAAAALATAPAVAMPITAGGPAPAASSAKPYKWEGYSDKPVEAKLGPYRFRFPMNMYYDQMGPDFQGGVVLVLQWPSLEPYPPGENFHSTTDLFIRYVKVDLTYLDRISDEAYPNTLRRSMQLFDTSNPAKWLNPRNNLDLRLKGAPVYGLTPYYLDLAALKAYYVKLHGENMGTRAAKPDDTFNTDWYLVFDAHNVPVTFIECAPKQIPDGVIVQGDIVKEDPQVRGRTSCTHKFLVPEYKLIAEVSYNRAFLKDWQRIEKHVRDLLHQSLAQTH